jgi:hypothetical protein
MLFNKNNHNKFVTASRKLDTETFELVTEFFEAQFIQTRMMVRSNAWNLNVSTNALSSNSRTSFTIIFALVRMSVVLTGRGVRSLHATPNTALMMIARSNVDILNALRSRQLQQTLSGKAPYIKCPGYCNKKDDCHDNQPKKLGYEKPKSGKVPCPIHFFPDKPAKHSWAKHSKNLANQRKQALQ